MMKVSSISAGLSSLLYVSSREESLGKERRLPSGKAVIEPMTKGKIQISSRFGIVDELIFSRWSFVIRGNLLHP